MALKRKEQINRGDPLPPLAERVRAYLELVAAACKGCARKGGACQTCMAAPAAGLVRDIAVARGEIDACWKRYAPQPKTGVEKAEAEALRERILRRPGAACRPLSGGEVAPGAAQWRVSYRLRTLALEGLIVAEGRHSRKRYTLAKATPAAYAASPEVRT